MTSKKQYRDYYKFLAENVVTPFYYERLMNLRCCLSLSDVLSRKNPYLLKAKNIVSPDELVRSIVDTFLSSREETVFGNKLEKCRAAAAFLFERRQQRGTTRR